MLNEHRIIHVVRKTKYFDPCVRLLKRVFCFAVVSQAGKRRKDEKEGFFSWAVLVSMIMLFATTVAEGVDMHEGNGNILHRRMQTIP